MFLVEIACGEYPEGFAGQPGAGCLAESGPCEDVEDGVLGKIESDFGHADLAGFREDLGQGQPTSVDGVLEQLSADPDEARRRLHGGVGKVAPAFEGGEPRLAA